MKVKETIAFIGEANETCNSLIRKLASENYPLILVTKKNNQYEKLSRQIFEEMPRADIEVIDCVKEGCWEADIIILTRTTSPDPELIEKMKEVANKKILVFISDDGNCGTFSKEGIKIFKQLLPNTEIVQVETDSVSGEMYIAGADDAVATITHIFNEADYKISPLKITM